MSGVRGYQLTAFRTSLAHTFATLVDRNEPLFARLSGGWSISLVTRLYHILRSLVRIVDDLSQHLVFGHKVVYVASPRFVPLVTFLGSPSVCLNGIFQHGLPNLANNKRASVCLRPTVCAYTPILIPSP